ncbi:DUF4388 domain-containing protein [Desulfogranum japonicum]|uniref:DUF4388 domain-containing protein n=1 Tax=Desulfogranum japonicum TaxID=231447 RepID=UPI00040E053B|nr:DUF4388 domain-containing protein [Desulfogranum japonicum]
MTLYRQLPMKTVLQSFFGGNHNTIIEPLEMSMDVKREAMCNCVLPALRGDIAAIGLEDVFQLFNFAGLTGELEVQGVSNNGFFFFEKGALIFGALDNKQTKIGELFLASGRITEEQLNECLAIQKQNGNTQRLGQILIAKGYIGRNNLTASLSRQMREAFFDVLTWSEGVFSFYLDHAPGKDEQRLHERVDALLLQGAMHIDHSQ